MLPAGAIAAIVAIIVFFVASILLLTVGKRDTKDSDEKKGKEEQGKKSSVICERRHLNYAWGYQNDGMYVDYDGNVYRFNASAREPFVDKQPEAKSATVTLASLKADRLAKNRTLVKTLSAEELQSFRNMFAQVEKENLGLGSQLGGAFDYGLVNTTCYKGGIEDESAPMRVYELDLDGDMIRRAEGENARNLATWLRQLDRDTTENQGKAQK